MTRSTWVALAAEGAQEPEPALEHGRRAGEAVPREVGGGDAGVGGPAAVHALHGAAGAVGLDDAGAGARRDADRGGQALGVQPAQHPDGHRRPDGAADRGGVLAVLEEDRVAQLLVVARHPEPAGQLDPHGRGVEVRGAGRADGLGGGERRRAGPPPTGAAPTAGGCRRSRGCGPACR